jgi:hypothetical protein
MGTQRLLSALLVASAVAGCQGETARGADEVVGSRSQAMVFGEDERANVAQHADANVAHWARSVGMLGVADDLCPGTGASCALTLSAVSEDLPGRPAEDPGLCSDVPFASESWAKGGKCTAFYVGSNRFVTAKHCFENVTCEQAGVLFDFQTDAAGNTPSSIPRKDNFYRCTSIIDSEKGTGLNTTEFIDFAVFEVDGPVLGHPALPLRRTGKLSAGQPHEFNTATPLAALGHQTLLPLKVAPEAHVYQNTATNWFFLTVDGGRGGSGGPIINKDTGFVEGILVSGPPWVDPDEEADYVLDTGRNCYTDKSCPATGCQNVARHADRFIRATRITYSKILAAVPELPVAPPEHVAIVLDQTGSMSVPGTDPQLTRWDDAINAAKLWTALDSVSGLARGYSIWTFKSDATQAGAAQVWPLPDSADCEEYNPATGHCRVSSPAAYQDLTDRLETLRESHRAVAGPGTPLAGSLCDVVSTMAGLSGLKRIILESDGGENGTSSLHACAGTGSAAFDVWDLTLDDWGMTVDSWEAKVIRRVARLGMSAAHAVLGVLTEDDAITDIVWQVDLHFGIQLPAALSAMSSGAGARALSLAPLEHVAAAPPPPAGMRMLAAPSAVADPQAEIDMFRALGSATPGSTFAQYLPDASVQHGLDHAVLGDADDSGCVDVSDYALVTHQSTWLARALAPNHAAIRADVNRDGWVNEADVAYLVENWRSGCTGPVAEPPSCHDHKRNNDESDLDCGGTCGGCTVGASCQQASDCATDRCADGLCACPQATHVILGTDGNDTLRGTPGADCIVGFLGHDTIDALGGNDLVFAGPGNDTIAAGDGDDRVYGEEGNDTIDGSLGHDLVLGQDGTDTCSGGTGVNALSCEIMAHCTAACCATAMCGVE